MLVEPSDAELRELESDLALDELWASVEPLAKAPKRKLPSAQAALREAEEANRAIYTNPANWQRTRGIALIHTETQTCLGNFAEYIHLRVRNCRKLIREEAPISVEAVEEVSGSWWLPREHKPTPVQVWHVRRPATLHIYLDELRVHAPAVFVTAFLAYGAIERVELVDTTRFAQWEEGGQNGDVLIDLPAGTNIFEVMSRASKIKLVEELGLK